MSTSHMSPRDLKQPAVLDYAIYWLVEGRTQIIEFESDTNTLALLEHRWTSRISSSSPWKTGGLATHARWAQSSGLSPSKISTKTVMPPGQKLQLSISMLCCQINHITKFLIRIRLRLR